MEEGGEAAEAAEGEAPAPEPEEEEVQVGAGRCAAGLVAGWRLALVGAAGCVGRRAECHAAAAGECCTAPRRKKQALQPSHPRTSPTHAPRPPSLP